MMDIVTALGLSNQILAPEQLMACGKPLSAAALASIKPTNITRAIFQTPNAAAVIEKFIRLEKYCASPLRLNITGDQKSQLNLEQSFSGQYRFDKDTKTLAAPVRAQMIGLFLSRSGYSGMDFAMDCSNDVLSFHIGWKYAPKGIEAPTIQSSNLQDHVRHLFTTDPARGWRIKQVTHQLGLTSRSLQRYLFASDCSFSHILKEVRISRAKALLKTPGYTLAEIGYCCGYADQAHFQREFRNIVQVTPRKYRLG